MKKKAAQSKDSQPTRFTAIVKNSSPSVRAIAKALRDIVFTEFPEASERFVSGARPLAMYRTVADICWIQPQLRWCNLYFARGTELSDPLNILEGSSASHRYAKVRSLTDLERLPIVDWLRETEELNQATVSQGVGFDETLNKLREFCLRLPHTKETMTWGVPHFRVGEKIFCGCSEEKGLPRLGLKMERLQSEMMMKLPGISKAPYSREGDGWVAIDPNVFDDWEEIERLIVGSFRLIAPKRVAAKLDASD